MHYFTKYTPDEVLTATCEKAGLVATLEARGFQRCSLGEWRRARRQADNQTRLLGDIHPPSFVANQDEPVVVTDPPPAVALPKVYASSWKH
jgi:hypothetical protein